VLLDGRGEQMEESTDEGGLDHNSKSKADASEVMIQLV